MAFVSARIVEATLRRNAVLCVIHDFGDDVEPNRPHSSAGGSGRTSSLARCQVQYAWVGQELADLLALTALARRAAIHETMRALLREAYQKWKQEMADRAVAPQPQDMSATAPFSEEEVG